MNDAYTEALEVVAHNKAAQSLLRDSAHHTVACQAGREQGKNYDVCYCDLMVHLADIVREERDHIHPSW